MTTFSNPLALIPNAVRVTIYLVYAFASIGLTATLAGYAAVQIVAPIWVVFGLAGLGSLGSAFGFTAVANVSAKTVTEDIVEPAADDEIDGERFVDESAEDEPADENETTTA